MEDFPRDEFEPGERLVRAGDQPGRMLAILRGTAEVYIIDSLGRERRIQLLGPGDPVGEMSLFRQRPASTWSLLSIA